MSRLENISGVFLVGGENTRFPSPKAFIEIDGEAIIDRALRIMSRLFDEIVVSTNQPDIYFSRSAILVGDVSNERGPATGILSSLINIGNDRAFVMACDMPFVDERLIRHLASYPDIYDAVVAVVAGKPEPLAAVYHRRIIPVLEKFIGSGIKSLTSILKHIETKYVDELKEVSVDDRSFININTPDDLMNIDNGRCNKL